MTPPRDAETIASGVDPDGREVVLDYDHASERYELVHYAHARLETTLGFVAIHDPDDAGYYQLLRRRETGRHAQGVMLEGRPAEAFGEAVGAALDRIASDDHPECADHV